MADPPRRRAHVHPTLSATRVRRVRTAPTTPGLGLKRGRPALGRPETRESPMQEHLDRVEPIAREVVAEEAARVDAEGKFPERSMRALREAGLLGLVSAREMGGA